MDLATYSRFIEALVRASYDNVREGHYWLQDINRVIRNNNKYLRGR